MKLRILSLKTADVARATPCKYDAMSPRRSILSVLTRSGMREVSFRGWSRCYRLVPVILTWVFAFGVDVKPATGPHGTVDLLAEQRWIRPGQDFWVGLHFQLEKNWHIYWVNPGDSGEPPKIQWDLPAGFEAGPIQWPTPMRLENPPLTDYGYEDEVLLMVRIRPRSKPQYGQAAKLGLTVKWLVCRDICIPGQARLTLSLPVREGAPEPDLRWRALFEQTRAHLPKRVPATWKTAAFSEKDHFVLSIDTGSRVAKATFFPLESQQIENGASQSTKPFDRGVRLTLRRSDQLLKFIPRLRGVVVLASGQAYVINAPVALGKTSVASAVAPVSPPALFGDEDIAAAENIVTVFCEHQ